jgi:integrase
MLYKAAKIYNAGGNLSATWYVHFSFRVEMGSRFIRKRVTGDINRIPFYEERMEAAQVLQKIVNIALESGYDPNAPMEDTLHKKKDIVSVINDIAQLKTPGLKKKSIQSYQNHINTFFHFLKLKGLEAINVTSFEPVHVNLYLQYLQKKKYSPVTINKLFRTVNSLFKKMLQIKIISDNPFTVFDRIKEPESDYFHQFTPAELQIILPKLKQDNQGLYLFGLFIYYCYMRPASIRYIQAKDIDFKARKLTIAGVNHKNGKTDTRQVLEPLYDALMNAGVRLLQPDTYLFGNELKPGQKPAGPNNANSQWKEVVMEGMGIKKHLYALKHTGASNYLADNNSAENLAWLQRQMGHSSLRETDRYVRRLQFVKLDESKAKIRKY